MRVRLLACTGMLAAGFSTIEAKAQETTTYRYDALGRLSGSSISGGPNSSVATETCFDAAGNRTLYFTGTSAAPSCPASSPPPSPAPAWSQISSAAAPTVKAATGDNR